MVRVPLHIAVDDPAVVEGLARIREEQHVPGPHDEEAVAEATAAAARALAGLDAAVASGERRDARDVEFVTVDPPGSRDLDQALHLSALDPAGDPGGGAGGWRVRYAIADVAAFVAPGGALDRACWDRGFTHYLPDGRRRCTRRCWARRRAASSATRTAPPCCGRSTSTGPVRSSPPRSNGPWSAAVPSSRTPARRPTWTAAGPPPRSPCSRSWAPPAGPASLPGAGPTSTSPPNGSRPAMAATGSSSRPPSRSRAGTPRSRCSWAWSPRSGWSGRGSGSSGRCRHLART